MAHVLVGLLSSSWAYQRVPPPKLGLLDDVQAAVEGVKSAYEDEDYVPEEFAKAKHILFLAEDAADVAEKKAAVLKGRIESGEFTFGEAALAFSCCPTRDLNGALGTFQSLSRLCEGTLEGTDSMPYDGKDTSPFDELVFSPETALNTVHMVNTQWGTHLVMVEERGGPAPPSTDDAVAQAADLISQAMGDNNAKGTAGFGSCSSTKKRKKKR